LAIEEGIAVSSRRELDELEEIVKLRAEGRAQGWPVPRIVEAIVDRFGCRG